MTKVFRSKVVRRLFLGILLLLVAIQLVPVDRSNPSVEVEVPAPETVRAILRRACYDCHSNETVWPWYSRVAPVSWLIARDVRKGREELNFSTWNRISPRQQAKRLQESAEEVAEGEMPPWFYVCIHRDARLTAEDRSALRNWAVRSAPAPDEPREE